MNIRMFSWCKKKNKSKFFFEKVFFFFSFLRNFQRDSFGNGKKWKNHENCFQQLSFKCHKMMNFCSFFTRLKPQVLQTHFKRNIDELFAKINICWFWSIFVEVLDFDQIFGPTKVIFVYLKFWETDKLTKKWKKWKEKFI